MNPTKTQVQSVTVILTKKLTVDPGNVFFMVKDKAVVLELIKTPEGRALLANTKRSGEHNFRSALHDAVTYHAEVALELIRTEEGVELLENTKTADGSNALITAVAIHRGAFAELDKRKMQEVPRISGVGIRVDTEGEDDGPAG